jgi:hypothetical protein
LVIRDVQLTLQDRKSLVFEWATALSISIVIGSVFLDQPLTTAGAFTRGGVIFMGLLFNVFMCEQKTLLLALTSVKKDVWSDLSSGLFCLAFSELPKQMLGRPIMWRQTSFCFYRPGARALAGAIAEIPFSLPKVFIFSLIVSFVTLLFFTGQIS